MKKQISNINKLEELTGKLTFNDEQQLLVDEISKEFTKSVVLASKNKVTPEEEDGKKLVNFGNLVRNFGAKFLNMFVIEFSISFAGVTLLHFRVPKLDNNKIKEENK